MVEKCLKHRLIAYIRLGAFASTLLFALEPVQASLQKVLHYHRYGYFGHPAAIAACSAALEQLSAEFRFQLKHSEDPAELLNLKDYDLVVYDNTTDAGGVTNSPTPSQAALIEYMNAGGRFLGFHGAGDDPARWVWYDTALFSGTMSNHWTVGNHTVYKTGLPRSDTGQALARMWAYAADSMGISSDSIHMDGEMLHWNHDVAGKAGVQVLQELRGLVANNSISESHSWVKFLPGGGRMLFTAMGHDDRDWTANDAWLKKATYAYMRYLVGDFDSASVASVPKSRTRGSRLEVLSDGSQSLHIMDLQGKFVASEEGATAKGFNLKTGVYIVKTRGARATASRILFIP